VVPVGVGGSLGTRTPAVGEVGVSENKQSGLTVCLAEAHDVHVPTTVVRIPQEERSRAMRQRLLDATVECLVERGWSGTSTTLVSQRAGVSRGAQLHHFPTKNDLVIAAVEHLSEVRGQELADAAAALPTGRRRTRAVLEMLAEHFTSPVFTAALELWVAARTDPQLAEAVGPLEQRIGREIHRHTVELLEVDESAAGTRELVQATLDLVRGLGLANTLTDDAARRARILDRWAAVLDASATAPRPANGRKPR
jgi:AcrR family transcriptional regulator